jgi:glycerol-3-phosphate dehydrogenase
VLNALDAAERGAAIRTRTRCVRVERRNEWELVLNSRGKREITTARVLVNAAGPWIGEVADTVIRQPLPVPARLIKGSHIVVRRRFEHASGYILQAGDGRVVFALPFANDFTLIGTTDENFVGDLKSPAPDAAEIMYLCDVANQYFRDRITPDELVWSYSGVRSLYNDGAGKPENVTRDYVLSLDEKRHLGPLLTIYGGKITTYRRLAESAMAKIAHFFDMRPAWTAGSSLPGGEFPPEGFEDVLSEMMTRWPFLPQPMARRLARAYGLRCERFLGEAESMADLGPLLMGDLTGAELRYLVEHEWAQTADDVLWRRSKLGLSASAEERTAIGQFIAGLNTPAAKSPAGP